MNIKIEKKQCSVTLNITIPEEDVTTERKKITSSYLKQAKIPGFRPGKAPLSVIEKKYKNDIEGQLQDTLIRQSFSKAMEQEKLKVLNVGAAKPEFNEDKSFKCEIPLTIAPEFDLPQYEDIEIEVPKAEVNESHVTQQLTELQQRFADFKELDREVQEDDFAVIDFTTTLKGKPVKEVIGKSAGFLDGREGHWVKVNEESFVPGFAEHLKGLRAGDTKKIELKLPNDFAISDLRKKKIKFDVTLKEVKQQELPELNDEFAGKLLPEKSLEELKDVIKTNLQEQLINETNQLKSAKVMESLTKGATFELPLEMIESEAQHVAQQMSYQQYQQGVTAEELTEKKDSILDEARVSAKNNIRGNFILQEIANKEKITVSQEELVQQINQLATQSDKDPQKYIKELQKNNQIENVRANTLLQKTIDFLVEKAKVIEVEPEEKEND